MRAGVVSSIESNSRDSLDEIERAYKSVVNGAVRFKAVINELKGGTYETL